MLRTIFGDDERYKDTYWSRFAAQGYYFAGDGAKYDTDGALWLLGRVDDVMNVVRAPDLDHRGGIRAGLPSRRRRGRRGRRRRRDDRAGHRRVRHPPRADAARHRQPWSANCKHHVAKEIGPIAKPKRILVVPELPKTRSGKIMRRLLRDIAENRAVGDVTTLQDSDVLNLIIVRPLRRQVLT